MKRKIVTVGICAIMMLLVFSSGCHESMENNMWISITNKCNEELDVNIYVDGKYIKQIHLGGPGSFSGFLTEYDEGRYTEKGYHRVRITTKYHDAGADISEDADFYLYPGGVVTYNDTQIA